MIEVIISLLVGSILVMTFITLVIQSKKIESTNKDAFRAELYLRETIEAAKDLEQSDWDEITGCASICHPEISTDAWTVVDGEETIDSTFTRSFSVYPVQRNQLSFPNEIVESGGIEDPNTKKVVASIEWDANGAIRTLTLETYIYK